MMAGGTYVAYTLNLLGPMLQMGNAAFNQGIDIAKEQLREFIANSDTAQRVLDVPMAGRPAAPARGDTDNISMDTLDSRGKSRRGDEDEGAGDDI